MNLKLVAEMKRMWKHLSYPMIFVYQYLLRDKDRYGIN